MVTTVSLGVFALQAHTLSSLVTSAFSYSPSGAPHLLPARCCSPVSSGCLCLKRNSSQTYALPFPQKISSYCLGIYRNDKYEHKKMPDIIIKPPMPPSYLPGWPSLARLTITYQRLGCCWWACKMLHLPMFLEQV